VRDSTGRDGIEVPLGLSPRDGPLRAALDALGAIDAPGLAGWAGWGWRREGLVVQLWWPGPAEDPEWI
jgi:hypothetical protein